MYAAVVFAALLAAAANAAPCTTEFPARNLTQVLNAATRLNLVGALAKNTVFAPRVNDLTTAPASVIAYHVTNNLLAADRIPTGQSILPSLSASDKLSANATAGLFQRITVNKNATTILVNGLPVVGSFVCQIGADDTQVHIINAVLPAPKNVAETATAAGLTTLVDAVVKADLAGALISAKGLTVFAPTNDAFSKIPAEFIANDAILKNILKYHVILDGAAPAYSAGLASGNVATAGGNVKVAVANGKVSVNGANVIIADVIIENGVVHVIDQVLIPPQLTLSSALSALSFNKLVDLVSFAGLVETVNSATGVTLFAPNDGAFPDAVVAALKADKDLLTNVLTYHIASGSYPSALLTKGSTVVNTLYTVSNTAQKARVFDGKVNTSPLVRVDVPYNNGVFHVISSALSLPTNLNATFYSSNYNVLGDLVKAAGLSSVFAAPGVSPNYTVFAPTNEAFAALGSEIPTYLTAAEGKEDLATILTYHVVSSPIYSANIPASVKVATLQKEELTVTSVNGKVSVNAATVVNPDVIATNGVVHGISSVLVPKAFNFNLRKLLVGGKFSILLAAIAKANLTDAILNGQTVYTILAPTDAAFQALGKTVDAILNDAKFLANVLKAHVIAGKLPAAPMQATSLYGDKINFNGARLQIVNSNSAAFTKVATEATNGVVYSVDSVLLPTNQTLVEVLVAENRTTLVQLVAKVGLAEVVKTSTLTVFAPVNEAFASVPKDISDADLKNVLLYHVVTGRVLASDITNGLVTKTALSLPTFGTQYAKLTIKDDKVFINDAEIVKTDTPATNGVTHAIKSVILPPAVIPTVATNAKIFTTLLALVTKAGLANALATTANLTVFAPTDDAFAALPAFLVNYLTATEGAADLAAILSYHVVPSSSGPIFAAGVPTSANVPTLAGSGFDLPVARTANGAVTAGNVDVVAADVLAANGVVHVLGGVMVPSAFQLTLFKVLIGAKTSTLLAAIAKAGLTDALSGKDELTVLAPTDKAFAKLGNETLNAVLADVDKLTAILKLHIIPKRVLSTRGFPSSGSEVTLAGTTLAFDPASTRVKVPGSNDAAIEDLITDGAVNGAVYTIDTVLLPAAAAPVASPSAPIRSAAVQASPAFAVAASLCAVAVAVMMA